MAGRGSGSQPTGEKCLRNAQVTGGPPSPSASLLRSRQPPPLRVTLVHRDPTVCDFVAELAAAQGWPFDAHRDFPEAAGALDAALRPNGEAAPPNAPADAAGMRVFLAALSTPSACGIEWTRRLAALDGSARFVLLAEQADASLGFSALYSGASAFLLLPLNRDELLTAIQRAAAGGRFIPATAVEASLDALCQSEPASSCTGLTLTEIRVLWAMAQGRGEKGAALLLNRATNTMHTHANHLYPKLGVHTLEYALHKLFGNSGCPYACLRRERERERGKSRGRGDEVRRRA
jgi:DNA-binding NarL/FixJ family response regulator